MAAFQRDKTESDCYEFEKYNEEAYRNLDIVKTLVLHGEMDAVLRSCAYEGSRLSDWWQETECDCMPRVLGWDRICKYAIKMYIILNLLYFFPESWDKDGVPVDDYRNIKAYQLAIRSCTKTGSLGDVAMYPHWDFFGIKKGQFRRYPKPFDVPRWRHFMRLERDRFCFWFHDDDAADDGVGLKAEGESIERSAKDPNGYYAYTLTFYPYGLISYEEFLNFETPVGHQISPSDVTYVRWILCQKGLPVEVSDFILEYADYTPRGSLSLSGKPLHPQCKQELDCYLDYCWQLIVRCYMLGNELKDKMDIGDLPRKEVKNGLTELFRYKWQLYGARLDHQGSAALGNLCLVCRQFRRIAQPLLYRTIVIEGRRRAKNISTLLLRTFVENPQLAEQVRAASLTDCVKISEQVEILGKNATKALVRSAMDKLDIPHVLKRVMKVHIADSGFAALILAYMPHVQVVDCTIGRTKILPWLLSASPEAGRPLGWLERLNRGGVYTQEYDFSDEEDYVIDREKEFSWEEYQQKGVSKGTFANYRFANLAEIRLRAVENPGGIERAWTIEPLLLNSRLKILRTLGTAWYGDAFTNFVWPEHKNYNLEYFDLMESYIDAAGLKTILTRCPKLKGVSIRLPDEERDTPNMHGHLDMDVDEEDCALNFNDFGDVLRKHGQNLEEFDFNTFFFESYSTWNRERGPGEGMIGSLRELRSLRHLGASKEALIGDIEPLSRLSEVLPESIETLHLYCSKIWETRDWVDSDRELHNQDVYRLLLDCMPNLREIRVERCKTGFDGTKSYDSDLDDATVATAADEYEDDASYFNDTDSEGLYIGQFGPEEFMYSKEAEWPPELHVAGWTVDIAEERLYKIRGRLACDFRVVTLTKKT
ncbi:hypothetical protein FPANT_3410 [Fusarium pseudoanthophilum]|uniref:Uncharacterized protein n=1 Tax=Fusarium pseudoanthophilum TaxID=48495 RepID=A0A8H5UV83_9HYPO|nr:hypothetical protein FPANT_3410 [Fusarium pseudoanthophilum]